MGINFAAVGVAALVNVVVGMIWHSVLFRKFMERPAKKPNVKKNIIIELIASLVMAYILVYFVAYAGATTIFMGAVTGFWLWLGLIATTTLNTWLWTGKPLSSYLISNGYHMISLMIMGAILAVWI